MFRRFCTSLLLLCLMLPPVMARSEERTATAQPAPKRVLAIFFGQRDTPYERTLEDGLRSAFAPAAGKAALRLETIYLDMFPLYQPERAALIAEQARRRFGATPGFDAVLLSGFSAARYFEDFGRELTSGPVVLVKSAQADANVLDLREPLRIADNPLAVDQTLELALRLFPQTREVLVISGTGPEEVQMMASARKSLARFQETRRITFIDDFDADTLPARLAAAPPDTIVLTLRISRDSKGRRLLPPSDYVARLARASRAPLFCTLEPALRASECIGGVVSAGVPATIALAEALREVVDSPASWPAGKVLELPSEPIFDARQMARWKRPLELLPAEARLINYNPTPYERFKTEIWIGAAVLGLQTLSLIAMLAMLSQNRRQRESLANLEQRWQLALEGSGHGVWDWDIASDQAYYSPEWLDLLGVDGPPGGPEFRLERIHPEDRDEVQALLGAHLEGRTPSFESDHRMARSDGSYLWVMERAKVVTRAADNSPLRLVGTLSDISERRNAMAQIEYLATHDGLTGLPNRSLLNDRLERALARARREGNQVAVIFIDLDHFKTINDTLGHQCGDLVLIAVAGRLMKHLREADTITRHGGDEFVLLLPELRNASDAVHVCEKLQKELAEPVALDGRELRISASMGIAMFPDDGELGDQLLQKADVALYKAKNAGRRNFCFFSESMNVSLNNKLELDARLADALRNGEIHLWYQPQFDLRSGKLFGAEALMRWILPDGTHIAPDQFIPVAEEFGHIHALGDWALAEACAQSLRWAQIAGRPIPVAVNLSAVQFRRDGLIESISRTLADTGLPASSLVLEITESVIMEDAASTQTALSALSSLGLKLAIDDFGTGYSSLAYLKRFPVSHLKIDRAFIKDLGVDPDDEIIVRTIIQLGHSLELEIVAEGVETETQIDLLTQHGCEYAQGYHYSRPLPAERFAALLAPQDLSQRNMDE